MKKISGPLLLFLSRLKKLSTQLLLLIFVFILCLGLLLWVADMVFEDNDLSFDNHIFLLIAPYINRSNTSLMECISFFGSVNFLLPANIVLAGFFLFLKKFRWYSLRIAAIALTSTAVMFLLKGLLKRQRPLLPVIAKVHGYSFPSGHSFSSLVFFGMVAYIAYKTIKNKWLRILLPACCLLFTFLIGFSRIYLKVHYASDVIAGFCLGIMWLILSKWFLVKAGEPATI